MSECLQFPWIPLRYPQTTPKYPPDISRKVKMSTDNTMPQTDTSRHTQTAPDSVRGCLGVSLYVCWRLFSSVGFLSSLKMSGGEWGMSGGGGGVSLWVFEWYSWKYMVMGCVWGVSGSSVLTVWNYNTTMAQTWKAQLFLFDHSETSKYQNVCI